MEFPHLKSTDIPIQKFSLIKKAYYKVCIYSLEDDGKLNSLASIKVYRPNSEKFLTPLKLKLKEVSANQIFDFLTF